jgi:hypothetical protein
MASYLLKMSVCYFNEPLLKDNSNSIGDNLASHNIQQVMIYNTHQSYWSVLGLYLLDRLPQILTPKSQLIILVLWSKSQGLNFFFHFQNLLNTSNEFNTPWIQIPSWISNEECEIMISTTCINTIHRHV